MISKKEGKDFAVIFVPCEKCGSKNSVAFSESLLIDLLKILESHKELDKAGIK